jgi:hypothetical protein
VVVVPFFGWFPRQVVWFLFFFSCATLIDG